MDGAWQVPLVPLLPQADVDEERRRGLAVALEERVRLRRRDLVDLGAGRGKKLPVARHYFREYSDTEAAGAEKRLLAAHRERDGPCPRNETCDSGPRSAVRGYRGAVSPFARVVACTAAAGAAAAVVVVGVVALQTDPVGAAAPAPKERKGAPPLTLELGVRTDPQATGLRRAARLYAAGKHAAAGRAFERIDSVEGRVGEAFATWPVGTVDRMNRLAGLHAQDAVVQLNLGVALFWSGLAGAREAWRAAAASDPDSAYAVAAGNLLHPEYAPGLPIFVTTARPPAALDGLAPPAQLELLRRNAARSIDAKLLYGIALQKLGRQRSAERVFTSAAREAPADAEAQVAAAVGRFDKARPAEAFSRLGPLTRRFPDRATVRFHLGLLLLWSGEVKAAKTQLDRAVSVEPGSPLARQAQTYLDELARAGV